MGGDIDVGGLALGIRRGIPTTVNGIVLHVDSNIATYRDSSNASVVGSSSSNNVKLRLWS